MKNYVYKGASAKRSVERKRKQREAEGVTISIHSARKKDLLARKQTEQYEMEELQKSKADQLFQIVEMAQIANQPSLTTTTKSHIVTINRRYVSQISYRILLSELEKGHLL